MNAATADAGSNAAPAPDQAPRFDRKVALVTGGASGIGETVCRRLIREGARVALLDRDRTAAEALAHELGPRALALIADVSDETQVEDAVRNAARAFGRLDIAINSAGVSGGAFPIHELERERWKSTLAVNLDGTFFAIKHAARAIIAAGRGGVIVNLASICSVQAAPGLHYCVSKAGVEMLTKVAALDLMPHGIRVVAVGPGLTDTPMNRKAGITSDPRALEAFLANVPMRRAATTGEIASAILYLASDEASYITGTTTYVDGGILLRCYPERRREA